MTDIIECFEYISLVHIQHYLQNVEDNNNSRCNFLPDVDLSSVSLYAAIYLEIIIGFTLKVINLWKKIGKQALTKQINIVEIETDVTNVITLLQVSI